MSTLKVDTYLTRGGASEIAIDKLKGVTAAGSMLVVAEGGTNTTNLQQGLCKQWANWDGATTVADSFNTTSATDNASGDSTMTIATAMVSINFTVGGLSKSNVFALQYSCMALIPEIVVLILPIVVLPVLLSIN